MLTNSIKMQMAEMLRKKTVIFTYFIILLFVMVNFFSNMVTNNSIKYVTEMYDPVKMLTLSDWSVSGFFLLQFYPLLVVIPTACSYLTDKGTGVNIYIQTKVGCANYWYGKLISVFVTTLLIYTIPFLIEIALSNICFSPISTGDPSNFEYYQTIESESQYFLSTILIYNKTIYSILMALLFGIVSAILAIFNFSLTSLPVFKYKIFTFFPIYILSYAIMIIESLSNVDYTMNYFFILRMFDIKNKNYMLYGIFLLVILCISIVLVEIKVKKSDTL